jgi:internalin A
VNGRVAEIVEERISAMRERGDCRLDLSFLNLEAIPDPVLRAREIKALELAHNWLRTLPDLRRWLPGLDVIDVRENPLEEVADQPHLWLSGDAYERLRGHLTPGNVEGLDLSPATVVLLEEQSARLSNLRCLYIIGGELEALPKCLLELSKLRELCVVSCRLKSLPAWLGELRTLRYLVVHKGYLQTVPATIARLDELEYLALPDNQLVDFPEAQGGLRQLKVLDLSNNPLRSTTWGLDSFVALEGLDMRGTGLTSIPDWVTQRTNLRWVNLSSNRISTVPRAISRLEHIKALWLGMNNIQALPVEVVQLTNLERLGLQRNPLQELPSSVIELPSLKELWLSDTALSNVPAELIPQQGPVDLGRLRAYFRELHSAGLDYLCEAKLLIVGEGDAGKTSLARKLIDPSCELRPDEPNTEGIGVLDWSIPANVVVRDGQAKRYIDRDIRVRIWDFAGQEIAHATHQFFLTKRSLYALVVDTRRDNPNFDYWLSIVDLLSDGSPLLLVKNEKQDAACLINDGAARARFPQLKEVLAVNLRSNRGLEGVVAAVRSHLQTLPHIGTPLPASWKRVREALEQRNENYIPASAFHALCDDCGFRGRDDQLQLSGYLHDLGVFLHFQRDDALSQLVILKPEWVTRAVYRVLRDREITGQHGRFQRSALRRIWAGSEYGEVRGALLELMRKFRLCYPLGDTDEFIIPQLLPRTQPEYPWDGRGNLQLQYHYDFMPKGIVPRLIVALHRTIERQAWVWQEGVVLARDQARAEVLEDARHSTIHVRLGGKNRLQLLGAIGTALDDIHAGYPKLVVRRRVPCSCEECNIAPTPHFFDAAGLRTFLEKAREEIQCTVSGEMMSVRVLLASVGDEIDPVMDSEGFTTELGYDLREPFRRERRPAPGRPLARRAPAALGESPAAALYVSYAWGGDSEIVVDQIEQAFTAVGVTITRDKKDVGYKGSIAEFMDRLAAGAKVIVVISERYLQSQFCMAELLGIADSSAEDHQFVDRIFPVVLADARIYKPLERIRYVKYWENERRSLNEAMRGLDQNNLEGFREDIDLFERIRNTLPRITDVLRSLNTLSLEQHQRAGFDALIQAVQGPRKG